jgi:hypothetical protein
MLLILPGCGGDDTPLGQGASSVAQARQPDGDAAFTVGLPAHDANVAFRMAGSSSDETFDGIGGLVDTAPLIYAYPEPQRSQILDYLFKPNYGQAIQVLKLEIGGDSNSTVASESAFQHRADSPPDVMNGYQTWMAQEALKRNPKIRIWGLLWGAPRWVGAICSRAGNAYLAKWAKLMKSQAGVPVHYLSAGQNEQTCEQGANRAGNTFDDAQNIASLRETLDRNGLREIRVIGYDGQGLPAESALAGQAPGNLYAVGVHYPGVWKAPLEWGPVDHAGDAVKALGIKYWASEDTDFQSLQPAPGKLTRQYNFRYLQQGLTLITNWSLIGAAYANMEYMERSENGSPPQMALYAQEPWSGHYTIYAPPFWSMAHTTQFTEPGWRYVRSASARLPKGGSIVSYRDGTEAAQDWTAVIETTDATDTQTIHLSFGSGFKTGNFSVFSSHADSQAYFENAGSFSMDDDGLTVSVKPHSIVTLSSLTGRAKGTAVDTAPASRPFPRVYSDTFNAYRAGETKIGYFAPVQGAFEIRPCAALRAGNCMTQAAAPDPIRWQYATVENPFMLVGNRDAGDATVKADVRLPDTQERTYGAIGGHAQLGNNRTDGTYTNAYGAFKGYDLRILGAGTWELAYTESGTRQVLASGQLTGSPTDWHRLQLAFASGKVAASIDGAVVSVQTADVDSLSTGMGALLSSYSPVQFDNFAMIESRL